MRYDNHVMTFLCLIHCYDLNSSMPNTTIQSFNTLVMALQDQGRVTQLYGVFEMSQSHIDYYHDI